MSLLENLATNLNLSYDEEAQIMYGLVSSYHLAVFPVQKNVYHLVLSLSRHGVVPEYDDLKPLIKESRGIKSLTVTGHVVTCHLKSGLTKGKTLELIEQAIQDVCFYLAQNHFSDVCQITGEATTTMYLVEESVTFLSDSGLAKLTSEMSEQRLQSENTKEQFIPGVVGSFLASLVGVIVIVVVGQLGYVSAISGIVMGLAVIKGYEWLGKKLTKKGIVAASIIMLVMTYFAYQLDFAISIARWAEVSILDGFTAIPYILESGDLDVTEYYMELAKLYLFTLVGFVPTLIGAIASAKAKFKMRQLR